MTIGDTVYWVRAGGSIKSVKLVSSDAKMVAVYDESVYFYPILQFVESGRVFASYEEATKSGYYLGTSS